MASRRLKVVYVCPVCRTSFRPRRRQQVRCSINCKELDPQYVKRRRAQAVAVLAVAREAKARASRAALYDTFGPLSDREQQLIKLAIRFGYDKRKRRENERAARWS